MAPHPSSETYTHHDIPSHIVRPDYVTRGGKVDQEQLPRRPVTWSPAEIVRIRRLGVSANHVSLMLTFDQSQIVSDCQAGPHSVICADRAGGDNRPAR